MGKQRASIDGHPLGGQVGWNITSGTRPFQTVVITTLEHGKSLLGGAADEGGPVTPSPRGGAPAKKPALLVLGGKPFKDVYVLHRAPAPSPKVCAITLSDRRWLWQYAWYRRSFNVPRKVGDKRMTSPNQLDAVTIDPKQAYKFWSLDGARDTPWTAERMLADIGAAIQQFEESEVGVKPGVVFPDAASLKAASVPINNVELDGPLDQCIERALTYLPGLDVTVRHDGVIEFFWRPSFDEMLEVAPAGPEVQYRGHIEQVDYSRIRPHKYRVFFDIECELKFKALELSYAGATTDVGSGDDDMYAENVLPIPDSQLTGTFGGKSQTLSTGCYVTMAEAFAAWGSLGGIGVLDFPTLRKWFVPFINMWDKLAKAGAWQANVNWIVRLAALRAHYRTTFRISPKWVDRFADVRAYRVGTINSETGTRGAASIFSDFCYLPTQRSFDAELMNDGNGGGVFGFAYNVPGYPIGGTISDTSIASPATMEFVDADQGVFHVDYQPDKFGLFTVALPSQIEACGTNTQPGHMVPGDSAGPTSFTGRSYSALGFNVMGRYDRPTQLTASHALLAVFTAVPGSPNSKRSLCWVDVLPEDVPNFPGRERCVGPMREIHIPATMETARIAWKDSEEARIKALFTTTDQSPIGKDEVFPLRDLVLNYELSGAGGTDQSAGGAVSLWKVAKAEAARRWQAERDRAVGSAQFAFRGDAQVRGAIESVTHALGMDGSLTTRYDLPGRIEPLIIERFLPSALVRIMRRMLHLGGK